MTSRCSVGGAALLTTALVGLARTAHAGVPGVIANSARTVADGVRDGAFTIGRTTRAFVLGGTDAAKDAWDENAELTREHARRNTDRVKAEAGVEREPDYDDVMRDRYDEPLSDPEPPRDEY